MKKNLIRIFLLVGAVTLNLSMLSQVRCVDNHKGMQVNAAATVAEHDSVITHSKVHEVKDGSGSNAQHGFGVKCVCGVESAGVHLDFNFNAALVESPPKNHALQAIPTAVSVFTNAAPVPQDRPPKLFA